MKDAKIQEVIHQLFKLGHGKRKIARDLKIDVKTVRNILLHEGIKEKVNRRPEQVIDEGLLKELYNRCKGYAHRMQEILKEEQSIDIAYSTLTRRIRDLGLKKKTAKDKEHYPDIPGEEMQHDTTLYTIEIDGKKESLICSCLYFRYSKIRYIEYYHNFRRFEMQCFLDKALRYFGYSCATCIIDNTSVVLDYGSGSNAHFNAGMVAFAKQYGFVWKAHAIRHPNRKAGVERTFHTIETNFHIGRTFSSLSDINKQAFDWATSYYAKKPQAKTGLIPCELFEYEKSYLRQIPATISPPYKQQMRTRNPYGCIAFNSNYYWIPASKNREVTVLEYASHIEIYSENKKIGMYLLPEISIRNKTYYPQGKQPNNESKYEKKIITNEEKFLRDEGFSAYLDFITSKESSIPHVARFISRLYGLRKRTSKDFFSLILDKALTYKVNQIDVVLSLASKYIVSKGKTFEPEIIEAFQQAKYKEVSFVDERIISE